MSSATASNASRLAWWVVIVAILAIVPYFLGFGVYGGLMRNDIIGYDPDGNWLQNLYSGEHAPITLLHRTPLKGPIESYVDLWERLLDPWLISRAEAAGVTRE
jgi:hypothetical protein